MKPVTKRRQQAAATKKKIFDCAVKLFAENPYERISVADICRLAGVSVGAFYHHFKNKESLLNEGYRLFDERLEKIWNEERPEPGRRGMELLVGEQMSSMQGMGAQAASQYFKNQLTAEEKYIINTDRFFYKTLVECVGALLPVGSDASAQTVTDDIVGLCRGTIYDWCLHGGGYDLLSHGMKALDMILSYYGITKN